MSAGAGSAGRTGMGMTLNGIAQGYITDRVMDILRENGWIGPLAIWAVAKYAPLAVTRRAALACRSRRSASTRHVRLSVDLCDRSVCTSGGYGTKFEATGRFHHLFDPLLGQARTITLRFLSSPRARIVADALSTALYVTPPERRRNAACLVFMA